MALLLFLQRLAFAITTATLWKITFALTENSKPSPATHDRCSTGFFQDSVPVGASVLLVEGVPLNGTFQENATNAGRITTATALPALCAVKISVPSSNSSAFDFALFLPDRWTGRMMSVGNGGFAGYINWPGMASMSRYGFASMSTNTGHYSADLDSEWALNRSESIIDWGYRAVHESTVLSKQLIQAYYGQETSHSYFAGCSNGGRQAMKEMTMYPEDYDGLITGAPVWDIISLFVWFADHIVPNILGSETAHISAMQFAAIRREIISQCDAQDDFVDGIVGDPYGCSFVPETLLCNGTANSSESCLTAPQLETLYYFLRDWSDTNQTYVFPTLDLGADLAVQGIEVVNIINSSFPIGFLRNFVYNDTSYQISDFDYLKTLRESLALNPGRMNVDLDLDAFYQRGGKLIQYHGLADPLVPSRSSVHWWSEIRKRFAPRGQSVNDWYHLFLVPGMSHCSGTDSEAPWYIAAAEQQDAVTGVDYSVPGYSDAAHDVVLAMIEWVEKGVAPDHLIATRWVNETVALGVDKQRPICAYPQQARYRAGGPVEKAESWYCR